MIYFKNVNVDINEDQDYIFGNAWLVFDKEFRRQQAAKLHKEMENLKQDNAEKDISYDSHKPIINKLNKYHITFFNSNLKGRVYRFELTKEQIEKMIDDLQNMIKEQ